MIYLENNKVPHEPGLEEADGNEGVEPDEASVEVSSRDVQGLLLGGKLGQTKPEGEDRQDDGGEPGQDEQEVAELEQLVGDTGLLGVGEDAAEMEHSL